jgi:hypothetical protein
MRIRDSNPTRFYHARQESILNLGDDPVIVISNSAIPSIRPPPLKLLVLFRTLNQINLADGFLMREALICLKEPTFAAGETVDN